MKLILIRHGDPDYENYTLTAKGKREALELEWLREFEAPIQRPEPAQ